MNVMPVFDAHLHVTLRDASTADSLIQGLLGHLRRAGIDRSCLMANSASIGSGRLLPSQDDQQAQCVLLDRIGMEHDGVLYPLLWLNPALPTDFLLGLIERHIVRGSCIGVKLSIQANARDPRVAALADYLQERDIPVLFHCWHKTVERYAYESDPDDLADLAGRYPRLRILAAHLTGCRIRGIATFRSFSNIWVDTSGSQPEDGYLQTALNILGADRLLFGSDHPGRDLSVQLARIDSVQLAADAREKILYRNALAFYAHGGQA